MRNLQTELKAEIERSNSIVASQQRSFNKSSTPNRSFDSHPGEGVKATQTHKLYEDLTNLLIVDCKCEASDNGDTFAFQCIHAPPDAPQDSELLLKNSPEAFLTRTYRLHVYAADISGASRW